MTKRNPWDSVLPDSSIEEAIIEHETKLKEAKKRLRELKAERSYRAMNGVTVKKFGHIERIGSS